MPLSAVIPIKEKLRHLYCVSKRNFTDKTACIYYHFSKCTVVRALLVPTLDGVGDRAHPIRRHRLRLPWQLGRLMQKFPATLEKLNWTENLMMGVFVQSPGI